jgi:biotin synthase
MTDWSIDLHRQIISGTPAGANDARRILNANGADLSFLIAGAHRLRETYTNGKIHLCAILNAKSGRCAENCAFCAQSAHAKTAAPVYPLKSRAEIVDGALAADAAGARCYGIVTSGTRVNPGAEFEELLAAIREIKTRTAIPPSASLGILDAETASALAKAGCATYHHNLETARSFFPQICTTHDYEEDVATIRVAKASGMQVCCGGLFGLGESPAQRIELALTLRELEVDSVPINFLNPVEGTRLEGLRQLSPLDCLRIVVMFRYLLPDKRISVCGGRESNLRELQSWIFMAGADGMMVGNYLTTSGRDLALDHQMLMDLGEVADAC